MRPARLVLAAALLGVGGCAAARFVMLEPGGGAVAIPRDTPDNHAKAAALMAQRCPGGYEILREEEVATGSEVTNEATTELAPFFDGARTTQRVTTRTRTEWRITFRCRDERR